MRHKDAPSKKLSRKLTLCRNLLKECGSRSSLTLCKLLRPPSKLNTCNLPLCCILSLQTQTSNLSPPFPLYLLQTYCCSVSAQPTHRHHFYDQTSAPLHLSCPHHRSNVCLPHHPFLSPQKLQHLLFPRTWYRMSVCGALVVVRLGLLFPVVACSSWSMHM